jgi:hypothetical protein
MIDLIIIESCFIDLFHRLPKISLNIDNKPPIALHPKHLKQINGKGKAVNSYDAARS